MPLNNGFNEVAFQNDTMIAGDDLIRESGIIATGQGVLGRGQIVGMITATGELAAYNAAAADGSEVIYGILAEGVDATAAAVTTTIYLAGEFKASSLVPTVTPTIKALLRALSIYAQPSV